MHSLWGDPLFKNTALIVLAFIALLGILFFPFRKKNTPMAAAWASVKSWLFGAPIIFLVLGTGYKWALYGISFIAILGAKEFFQITGMYHRSWFVWSTYIGIAALGYTAVNGLYDLYNLMPMIFLGIICLIPIVRNSAKHMVQYISLSLLNFIFIGWCFMHTLWITFLPSGPFFLIYLILLTELTDNVSLAVTRLVGARRLVSHKKLAGHIAPRRTWDGLLAATAVALGAGYLMRPLLPDLSVKYWLSFAIVAILVGSLGDLVLAVIRRDLGVKDVGIFIIGRGGFLDRLDRLIFTAPIYYYVIVFLSKEI